MMEIKKNYKELIHLAQLFLLREYSQSEVRVVDPAILDYFQTKSPTSSSQNQKKQKSQHVSTTTSPPISTSQLPPQRPLAPPPPTSIPPVAAGTKKSTPLTTDLLLEKELPPSAEVKKTVEEPTVLAPATPPSPPPFHQEKGSAKKSFILEPMAKTVAQDKTPWWKLCHELFPRWPLQETPPSDSVAKKNKELWKNLGSTSPVVILSFDDNEQHLTFLKNVAQAITLRLAEAQVISAPRIEKEGGWEQLLTTPHLRLVIAGDYGLYMHPKLMHYYKENPQQHKHHLHNTPLLLLSDPSLYLKEPQLKALLWRAICNEFASTGTSQSER